MSSDAGKDPKSPKRKALENDDSDTRNGSNMEAPEAENSPNEASPELQSQIAMMENIKVKAAAINPANLIPALLKTPEDQLIAALPTFRQLTELFEGTPLGTFLLNLEIVVTDSSPYLWHSVIESYPDFVGSITEAGEGLAALANTEDDQLTIFNEKEMGLNDIFPVADVFVEEDSFSQVGPSEKKIEEMDFDNVGQVAEALQKLSKGKNKN